MGVSRFVGEELCEGCFVWGVCRTQISGRSVSAQEKQPKSNSFSALKQKEFQAKMGYTFALEIFFFQPVPERNLAVSLWGGNYCTATTKQRRVH